MMSFGGGNQQQMPAWMQQGGGSMMSGGPNSGMMPAPPREWTDENQANYDRRNDRMTSLEGRMAGLDPIEDAERLERMQGRMDRMDSRQGRAHDCRNAWEEHTMAQPGQIPQQGLPYAPGVTPGGGGAMPPWMQQPQQPSWQAPGGGGSQWGNRGQHQQFKNDIQQRRRQAGLGRAAAATAPTQGTVT